MSENKEKFELNELDRKGWVRVIASFLTYVVGMGIFFKLEHYLTTSIEEGHHLAALEAEEAAAGIAFGIMMLVIGIVLAIINRELLKEQWHHMMHEPKKVALWAVIGACLVYAIMTLNHHFFHGPHHAYTKEASEIAGALSPILFIGMTFGMAFVEEMSYKVCCFLPVEGLELKKASLVAALLYGLLNCLVFAIFAPHYALGAFLMYTVLGLKFGLLYYNTHTIFTSIFAGTIYGIVATLIALL